MATGQGLGQRAIEEIASVWHVAASRSVRRANGFDWWPGDYCVSVTAVPQEDRQQPDGALIWVQTDFLADVPIKDDKFVQIAAATSRFLTSTYAWAYPPAEIWTELAKADDTPKLWLANTAYVRDDNVNWLPRFLAQMSILQPINAQLQAANMQGLIGGVPDTSRPPGMDAIGLDEILQVAADIYVPIGDEPSRWIGTNEFEAIAKQWGQTDNTFGFGDAGGLTLETPFGGDSALIRLLTDQRHPQLGNGLLATLQLPFFDQPTVVANECAFLNYLERMSWTDIPLFGCWHPHTSRADRDGAAFTTFVPNALYRPGIATNMALWLLGRAAWARKTRWPKLQDLAMAEIIHRRLQRS